MLDQVEEDFHPLFRLQGAIIRPVGFVALGKGTELLDDFLHRVILAPATTRSNGQLDLPASSARLSRVVVPCWAHAVSSEKIQENRIQAR